MLKDISDMNSGNSYAGGNLAMQLNAEIFSHQSALKSTFLPEQYPGYRASGSSPIPVNQSAGILR